MVGTWVRRLAVGIGSLGAMMGVSVGSAAASATVSFTSPGTHVFTVPAGVTSITVTAVGAAGGTTAESGCGLSDTPGGQGASVTATLPVTPGEQLPVGVGAVGGGGDCTSKTGGAGGEGGGGGGGSITTAACGTTGGCNGAGGGGASFIGLASPWPTFDPLPLVIAGGGGGAGSDGGSGGDAGAPGAPDTPSAGGNCPSASFIGCGGGAGTSSGGGVGGPTGGATGNNVGASGAFAIGGAGGASSSRSGGGGGGGGYFGGGGGGAGTLSGGGGGGSSFTADATNVSGPTATSNAAEVSITYGLATANPNTSSLAFGTTPQGILTKEQIVSITNSGSAALVVSAAYVTGANRGDYLVSNRCQNSVTVGGTCEIGVRFAPQAAGARPATLTIESNDPNSPLTISLSGTGLRAPSSTSLSLAKSTVTYGSEQLERFSVTVTPQTSGVPTGKVAVRSGKVALCTVTLSAGKGSCSPSPTALAAGSHSITAAYAGDANFSSSASSSRVLTVKK